MYSAEALHRQEKLELVLPQSLGFPALSRYKPRLLLLAATHKQLSDIDEKSGFHRSYRSSICTDGDVEAKGLDVAESLPLQASSVESHNEEGEVETEETSPLGICD